MLNKSCESPIILHLPMCIFRPILSGEIYPIWFDGRDSNFSPFYVWVCRIKKVGVRNLFYSRFATVFIKLINYISFSCFQGLHLVTIVSNNQLEKKI